MMILSFHSQKIESKLSYLIVDACFALFSILPSFISKSEPPLGVHDHPYCMFVQLNPENRRSENTPRLTRKNATREK